MSPASSSVPLGDDFSLHCSADGHPVPTIEWVHFDTPVRNSDVTTIEEEMVNTTITSTLTVMNASTNDLGQYNCRASTAINESLVVESDTAFVSLSGKLYQLQLIVGTYPQEHIITQVPYLWMYVMQHTI